jgi:dolichol-phosphate mannosyltransferase
MPTQSTMIPVEAGDAPRAGLAPVSSVCQTVVLVPTYFEAGTVGRLVAGVQSAAPGASVLIVDDASTDGTVVEARRSAIDPARLVVLERPAKGGLGSAYRDGFRWALDHGARVVATMDADLSHDPADLPRLLAAVEAGADVAVGSRFVSGGSAPGLRLARRLISRVANLVSSRVLALRVRDSTSGFRAYRLDAPLLEALQRSTSCGFSIQVELVRNVVQGGGRVVEIPIRFADRAAGRSKFSAAISVEAARNIARWAVEGAGGGTRATFGAPARAKRAPTEHLEPTGPVGP